MAKHGIRIENSAKAVIVSERGLLVIRYEDTSDLGLGTWYSLPGGRQRFGETLAEALVRECKEELGAVVSVGPLLFVREYVHSRHELSGRGRDQHKVEFMFRCILSSDMLSPVVRDPDQAAIRWVQFDELDKLNIFPTQLRRLAALLNELTLDGTYWGDCY